MLSQMLKRSKTLKTLSALLPLLLLISLTDCASNLPAPPQGNLYNSRQPAGIALCAQLGTGTPCDPVPISETNGWYMFTPQTYNDLMDYIDKLVNYVSSPTLMVEGKKANSIELTRQDLLQLKKSIQKSHDSLVSD